MNNLILKRKLPLPFLIIFVFLVAFPLSEADGGNNPKKKVKHWEAGLSISPYYDSNILKYSDKYIQRFINLQDEGRFHINRYDDLVAKYSAGLSYSNRFIKKLNTILSADFSYNKYSFNSIKDWARYSVGWRQYFYSKSCFMISYSFIPHFYVRHFRDEDWIAVYGYTPITFKPYEFSKDDYSFWIQHYFFKNTMVRAYFSYMKYFLDKDNTEYDSNDFLYGIRIFQKLTKKLKVDVGYKYITSDAKGYDQPGETKQTSDDVDATNYSHNYLVGINYDLPRVFRMRNSISLDFEYERCFYTTDNFYELDRIHAGRHDKNYELTFTYDISMPGNVRVSAFYSLFDRKTGTPAAANAEYISDEKSYNQYQTWIRIDYNFKF
jgi:hypothetical protein